MTKLDILCATICAALLFVKCESQSTAKVAKRETQKCLMKGVCDETAFGGIPCVSDEEPAVLSDPEAVKELLEMCPHLAGSDSPLLCCTDEQVIRLNHTFEMLSMFLKECPPCVRNFEKVICHLSCSADQSAFMRITRTDKNKEQKDMVTEVEYFVSDQWAEGVYDSCKGVHRLGFNVLDHYCKPHKSKECDHKKFLQFIGGDEDHFGHSPFQINFKFSSEESLDSDGKQYIPAKQSYYKCTDSPHTGEGNCPCIHCHEACAPGEERLIAKQLPKYKDRKRRESKRNSDWNKLKPSSLVSQLGQPMCLFKSSNSSNKLCLDIREPMELKDKRTIETLRDICPDLVQNGSPLTCCDEWFIDQMDNVFRVASRLGLDHCPACMRNVKQIMCQFSCSPQQSQFIKVTNATKAKKCHSVEELEYYIDIGFAQTLFDSCKSLFGGKLMKMMCRQLMVTTDQCSLDKWIQQMGRSFRHNGYSPYHTIFKLSNTSELTIDGQVIRPMNGTALECNHTIEGKPICDCAHCQQSCD